MRKVTLEQLANILKDLPANPRVLASGNFATPQALLGAVDDPPESVEVLCLKNQPKIGIFIRPGVPLLE